MSDTIDKKSMNCRKGCGACCIAISISSPLPGMPNGKPAGVRCIHLSQNNSCTIHSEENYPLVCRNLLPSVEMCGYSFIDAMEYLTELEKQTAPSVFPAPAHKNKKQSKGVLL